jgi:predicted dehydrogenase/threonine dehydrogenase-like Zn-dependent dehydrogenase
MKQVVQNMRSGQTMVIDVPVPKVAKGMVLVRTAASLVSAGTERHAVSFASKGLVGKALARPDLVRQVIRKARREGVLTAVDAARNRLDRELPLGYSSAGTVVEVGKGVSGVRAGDRVACGGGGYAVHAEFCLVPRNLIARLPHKVDFESGAFATLGAVALHGFRLGAAQIGERVGVIGLGVIGLLTVAIARAAGCEVFAVDLDTGRVKRARKMGARAVLRSEAESAAEAFTHGAGLDSILICADTPTNDAVELAGAIARDRASVVAVGLVGTELPRRVYYDKELSFIVSRSYGPGRYDPTYEEQGVDYPVGYVRWTEGRNLEGFVRMMEDGVVDVRSLITHRFPVAAADQAYELIQGQAGEDYLGVLLTYESAAQDGVPRSRVQVSARRPEPTASVGLGVLGAGNFAYAVLLPMLRRLPSVDCIGIASAGGLSGAGAARKFGFRYTTTDISQILDDPQINVVAVLTRHNQHARQTVEALKAGKHVFCEKPLALTWEELESVAKALRSSGRMLMVGFNRRFAPMAARLREAMAGAGEPLVMNYRVNAGYLPPSHWAHDPELGGGRILGEVCHFIDLLTFVAGGPPVRVSASGLPGSERYRDDNVLISLSFPDGSIGTIAYVASGSEDGSKERLEVFGGGRTAVLEDFRRLEVVSDGKRHVWRDRFRQDKGHLGEWLAFVESMTTGGQPPIPYEQLFGVTLATLAAVESLRSGKPVEIAPISLGE